MVGLWQLDRVSAGACDAAESAAQGAGLPLPQWLGRVIAETAAAEGVTPAPEPPPAPRPIPTASSTASFDASTLILPPAAFDIGTVGTRHGESDVPEALVAAIAREGMRRPILVRRKPGDEGRYEIISGRRRWRAARRLGLTQIDAVVTDLGDSEAVLASLTENLAQGDLSPIDEARAYLRLLTEFSLDPRDVSTATGCDMSHIVRTLRLMGLPPQLKELVSSGRLTRNHAYALLDMPDQERAAEQMLAEQAGIDQALRRIAALPGAEHRP